MKGKAVKKWIMFIALFVIMFSAAKMETRAAYAYPNLSMNAYLEMNAFRDIQVTDGKKVMGYVSSKYVKSLYESSYALKVDSPMYGIIKYDSYRFHDVSGEMRPFNYEASDNIICTLPVETEVEEGNAVYNPTDFNESYSEIILPDGIRGCVLSKNLKKIKKVIS